MIESSTYFLLSFLFLYFPSLSLSLHSLFITRHRRRYRRHCSATLKMPPLQRCRSEAANAAETNIAAVKYRCATTQWFRHCTKFFLQFMFNLLWSCFLFPLFDGLSTIAFFRFICFLLVVGVVVPVVVSMFWYF